MLRPTSHLTLFTSDFFVVALSPLTFWSSVISALLTAWVLLRDALQPPETHTSFGSVLGTLFIEYFL